MPEGYSFNSFDELFEKVKKHCLDSGAVQETAYKLWIVPLEARDFDGKQVTLFFAKLMNQDWTLKNRFKRQQKESER